MSEAAKGGAKPELWIFPVVGAVTIGGTYLLFGDAASRAFYLTMASLTGVLGGLAAAGCYSALGWLGLRGWVQGLATIGITAAASGLTLAALAPHVSHDPDPFIRAEVEALIRGGPWIVGFVCGLAALAGVIATKLATAKASSGYDDVPKLFE